MVSHPETSSDSPIGSDRESGCDTDWYSVVLIISRNFYCQYGLYRGCDIRGNAWKKIGCAKKKNLNFDPRELGRYKLSLISWVDSLGASSWLLIPR